MKYLSVCSGIEAATVAWHNLGWQPVGFSEIEPFPSAVLKHHYPNTPNLGDMTKYKEWNIEHPDLLVGGTPCQSFSVAGLRKGLDDPRGNLMLTYLAIAQRYRPRWLVWENVPGVLSSNGGEDFASLLRGMAELGYGWAYRILDAQYFGVAQRRRRVFVVGCLGDWRPAVAVLFERHSLSGNPAPSREKRKKTADSIAKCLTARGAGAGNCDPETSNMIPVGIPDVMSTLLSSTAGISRPGNAATEHETYIPMAQPIPIDSMNHLGRKDSHSFGDFEPGAPCYTLTKGHSHAVAQPIAFHATQDPISGSVSPALGANMYAGVAQAVGCLTPELPQRVRVHGTDGTSPTLSAEHGRGHGVPSILSSMAVRRLTPVECERLQGFPDNYTAIPWRGKETPDGPRYKALGNSMAVPVMRWIGERIKKLELN